MIMFNTGSKALNLLGNYSYEVLHFKSAQQNQFSCVFFGLVSFFSFPLQITRDKTLDQYLNYEFKNRKKGE